LEIAAFAVAMPAEEAPDQADKTIINQTRLNLAVAGVMELRCELDMVNLQCCGTHGNADQVKCDKSAVCGIELLRVEFKENLACLKLAPHGWHRNPLPSEWLNGFFAINMH
jgi:hypothetical protein